MWIQTFLDSDEPTLSRASSSSELYTLPTAHLPFFQTHCRHAYPRHFPENLSLLHKPCCHLCGSVEPLSSSSPDKMIIFPYLAVNVEISLRGHCKTKKAASLPPFFCNATFLKDVLQEHIYYEFDYMPIQCETCRYFTTNKCT